ncbi:hypothetical protein DL766_008763 [Monosporascus sp. MC13-8B]|uniref:mannan endo-1,6-alpha-mannosidase n=1 Tax=Monosporascus cannonballus TaxID=155416 RepID=A0ABY0HBY3_9PEZI|nr:hypothetical protein DL763_006758 [Monosporascus cannonballus]RYO89100.1 hypothetical protein DL762_003380 [Monosporascus cannonballus]RYP18054.1 hypothetical protein DL766_008763 [Monosporascus sp. MC13-8B]
MIADAVRAASAAAAFVAPKDLDVVNADWWQAGAAWGAMLDYSHYTGDSTYDDVVTEALLSQVGPNFDYMTEQHRGSTGNDDQAFWAFAVLEAAERNFPQPDESIPHWLDLATNIWNSMVVRWNTTHCGGGFTWQIFPDNPNGMNYKNSISNGGFFQMSARLARMTGNDTYFDWAQKVWDWSDSVGLIDKQWYFVYDGVDAKDNCATVNPHQFSYTQAVYTYGAAVLYNYTNGDETWGDRTAKLLKGARVYFSPFENATNIMYEAACEPYGICNTDQKSFKGYVSRFLWATTRMMPSTLPEVRTLLTASAIAAGKACSGGEDGTTCGQKWYTGGYDGVPGLGQQMSALETVQGLLAQEATPPFQAGEIKRVRDSSEDSPTPTSDLPVTEMPTKRVESPIRVSGSAVADANENAYGPSLPAAAVSAASSSSGPEIDLLGLHRYPDPHQRDLKQLLCHLRNTHHHTDKAITPDNLFVGVGSDEAIDALLRCFCVPRQDRILVCPPTYGMYSVSAQVNDVGLVKVPLLPAPTFALDTEKVATTLSNEKNIKLVYLCSPGNPTGSLVAKEDVKRVLEHPTWNGVVVLDEAYIDFAPEGASLAEWVAEWPNLVVMQTLSKAFGMAGIRLGAAFTSPPIARILNSLKAPYNISSPTSALASYVISEDGLAVMRANRERIMKQRDRLIEELPKIKGVGRLRGGTASNFLLYEILNAKGEPDNATALAVYERLAEVKGVVVRFRGKEHGCLGCLRVTVGTEEEVTRFLAAVQKTLAEINGAGSTIPLNEEKKEVEANGVVA